MCWQNRATHTCFGYIALTLTRLMTTFYHYLLTWFISWLKGLKILELDSNRGSTKNFLKRKKFLLHLCVLFSYCFLQLSVASQLSAGVKTYDQRGILKTEGRISHSGDRSEGSASALTVLPGIQLALHLTFVSI